MTRTEGRLYVTSHTTICTDVHIDLYTQCWHAETRGAGGGLRNRKITAAPCYSHIYNHCTTTEEETVMTYTSRTFHFWVTVSWAKRYSYRQSQWAGISQLPSVPVPLWVEGQWGFMNLYKMGGAIIVKPLTTYSFDPNAYLGEQSPLAGSWVSDWQQTAE